MKPSSKRYLYGRLTVPRVSRDIVWWRSCLSSFSKQYQSATLSSRIYAQIIFPRFLGTRSRARMMQIRSLPMQNDICRGVTSRECVMRECGWAWTVHLHCMHQMKWNERSGNSASRERGAFVVIQEKSRNLHDRVMVSSKWVGHTFPMTMRFLDVRRVVFGKSTSDERFD